MSSNEKQETSRDSSQVQVITRAVNILKILGNYPDGLNLTDLSKEIELPRSTVHRIVSSLESNGFIAWDKKNGRVRLGIAIAILGKSFNVDLRNEIRPFMETLLAKLNETVDFAILYGDHGLLLDRLDASHLLKVAVAPGTEFDLYCTASGKAMLSMLENDDVVKLLPETFKALSSKTIVTIDDLIEEIEIIRQRGCALDREEQEDGICAIGIAFKDPFGSIGALSLPIPSIRFYENEKLLIETVTEIRAKIQAHFDSF